MLKKYSLSCLVILVVILIFVSVDGFSGHQNPDVLYKINWPGKIDHNFDEPQEHLEYYPITTADNEKYICTIPVAKEAEKNSAELYTGPNPIDLLTKLVEQNSCSYKLESYWTYEVCHGRYVRQFHEEREGKKIKIQEYSLGTFAKGERERLSVYYDELAKNPDKKLPTKKFDGVPMPYVEIKMTNGTLCDLSNKPRTIKLLYICHQHGKNEILSFEETSSCEYEAIIFTSLICSHPDYGPRGHGEDEINCIPTDKTPKKPKSLAALEAESIKLRHQKVMDGEPRVRVEIHSADEKDLKGDENLGSLLENSGQTVTDISPVKSFLSGKHCLHGGHGWWKYEFCYARSVVQYHVERDGSKLVVDLGKFDKKKHIEWIEANPIKKPKQIHLRKQLSHFYGDGSYCEKTGKSRQTEVRLMCAENQSGSTSSVSLSLHEPKTCEYVLSVESALICDILALADDNGLINNEPTINFEILKTETSSSKTSNKDETTEEKKIEL
ncbi:endoplasmic reticulum lectin 1 isoform X2 [Aphidius gifuensis]|uniref:endoplasmic reticulum lectin 1 isoform X2 n=1 Tax=Aphidius gifuensis TaxID=684658 RepID=UPI001CDB75FE|nr:endoplasmic reticulum lectin 1 isoform X2 [Aphidius gifuensis]